MITALLKTIRDHRLIETGNTIIVGVSGGVDSMVLLDYLAGRDDLSLQLVVAHLNHMLRGDESDSDEEFVRDAAISYDLAFESRVVDVKKLSKERNISLEEAGREARYRFFYELLEKYSADSISVAHHADDQAETLLMRLIRGSGITGLSSMRCKSSDGRIIRPFLWLTRSQIEAYALVNRLSYRVDSSNKDTSFLRNRIRYELIPILMGYNPLIVERLSDTASIMAAEDEMILTAVDSKWAEMVIYESREKIILNIDLLRNESGGLRFRIYRNALFKLSGGLKRISCCHLDFIDRLLFSVSPNSEASLPGNLKVLRFYKSLEFSFRDKLQNMDSFEIGINSIGTYTLSSGCSLVLKETDDLDVLNVGKYSLLVDIEMLPFPWTVRSFKPGDRMIPKGMSGRKKVKDIFVDCKVPKELRARIPLFFSGEKLFWLPGLRKSACLKAEGGRIISVQIIDKELSLYDWSKF